MTTPRAVLFTHVGDKENLRDPNQLLEFDERRRPFFKACLKCRNIGIVYVYSSFGVEYFVHELKTKKEPQLPLSILETEQHIFDAIQIAIDNAASDLHGADPEGFKSRGPKFFVIGVRELASHLLRLQRINPALVRSIAARKGTFTYDSPKYIESILRLARRDGDLANDPILRVDVDVEVNEHAIQVILDHAAQCERDAGTRFWWFSGGYTGKTDDDPINVHAVRQHWLTVYDGKRDRYKLPKKAQSFLIDLAEIGATQVVPSPRSKPERDRRLSAAARKVIADRGGVSKNRRKPQVISGAGLVASAAAIRRLPPFVNAAEMVVWIDDHLKRLLHEKIGDILPTAVERLPDALMKQDRFPKGVVKDDERTREYFRRLLNGCLLEAAIEDGPFADAVRGIVDNGKKPPQMAQLRRSIETAIAKRMKEVMKIWSDADYGNSLLSDWASSQSERKKNKIRASMLRACMDYLRLCLLWPQHVKAITDLAGTPHDAYWLFTKPRPVGTPGAIMTTGPKLDVQRQQLEHPRMQIEDFAEELQEDLHGE